MSKKFYLTAMLYSFFNLIPLTAWATGPDDPDYLDNPDEPSPHCSEITEQSDCDWIMGSTTDAENNFCSMAPREENTTWGTAHCMWDADQAVCRARCVSIELGDDALGPWVPQG